MFLMKHSLRLSLFAGSFLVLAAQAQTLVEGFEYATDDDLLAAWTSSSGAALSVSDSVAPNSAGTHSLRVDFSFGSSEWATETLNSPYLPEDLVIAPDQYLTFRLRGDSQFGVADFRNLYLYAYDADGNFGRWGGPVPTTTNWQVMNYKASTIEKPWNSTSLPDFNHIVRFAFFQYGSQAMLDPYAATIYIDDLSVRNEPLVELPPPAAPRTLIDDFEGYADDAALRSFYSYMNSPAALVTTATLASPAAQGTKALKLAIDFVDGQYPWGSVISPIVAPFSIPSNAIVTLRIKGDPSLSSIADAGTTFWLSFYDGAGRGINFSTPAAPVISSEWTTLQATLAGFWSGATVDTGNLVQWRILVEGWEGTAETTGRSAAFYIDNIRVTVPPATSVTRSGTGLNLQFSQLVPGLSYELRTTTDFQQWTVATTLKPSSTTASWSLTPNQGNAFFQLVYVP